MPSDYINKSYILPVSESSPKATLLKEVVDEIYQECLAPTTTTSSASSSTEAPTTSATTADSAASASLLERRNGKTLIFTRDEKTAKSVRDAISYGDRFIMDQKHRWFVSRACAAIRSKVTKSTTTTSALITAAPSSSSSSFGQGNSSISTGTGGGNSLEDEYDYLSLGVSKKAYLGMGEEQRLLLHHVSTSLHHSIVIDYNLFI